MLWKKKKPDDAAKSEPRPSVRGADADADKPLEALSAFLRTYGRFAFDTEEVSAEELAADCEKWAERLLIGERQPAKEEGDSQPAEGIRRDWAGVRRFFEDARQQEGEFVNRSLGNLRQAIQTFAQCLTKSVSGDRRNDELVEKSVVALSQALSANDTERIRREAGTVVHTVRDAIAQRKSREEKQMKLLGERLRYLRGELSEAREAAATDALTGLSNRAALDHHLERVSDLGLLFSHPPCLLMIDLDRFKQVNDTYGHPGGDAVLREVAKHLTRSFLRKQDFVARFGGEEFAVVLVDTEVESAKMLVSRVCNALRNEFIEYDGHEIEVTLSVGIASLTLGQSPEEWIARADRALYKAKKSGRDRIVLAAA